MQRLTFIPTQSSEIMQPAVFLQQFNLHDSVVEAIGYRPERAILTLSLDLCNYLQPAYEPDQPELVQGDLVLFAVSKVLFEPDLIFLAEMAPLDGQILQVNLGANGGPELKSTLQFVMLLSTYNPRCDEVVLLTVEVDRIQWNPQRLVQGEGFEQRIQTGNDKYKEVLDSIFKKV